jgi:hypothetical protein
MAATDTTIPEFTVTLTEEERAQLLSCLEQLLRDKQIEVHRTDALAYREFVQHQEVLLRRLIDKVRRP